MKKRISIDLHLHFDGSLSIKNVRELAMIEGIALDINDDELRERLTVSRDCKNLGEYLTKFAFPLSLLQSAESIEKGMHTLCRELLSEGCIYAEIRFAPQLHLDKGLTQDEVVDAAIRGFETSGLCGGLILCCMRSDDNRELNEQTVAVAKRYLGQGVLALDLAGNEAGYATSSFRSLFEIAREAEVPFTIHAGEADSAESVICAIEMGAQRIGHGVRSFESEALMQTLAKEQIPLEMCPTSNLQTAIFERIEDYPIKLFYDRGICVTLNSDNRSVSATDAHSELELVCRTFGFGESDERRLLENSVKAAFADEKTKRELMLLIADAYA